MCIALWVWHNNGSAVCLLHASIGGYIFQLWYDGPRHDVLHYKELICVRSNQAAGLLHVIVLSKHVHGIQSAWHTISMTAQHDIVNWLVYGSQPGHVFTADQCGSIRDQQHAVQHRKAARHAQEDQGTC